MWLKEYIRRLKRRAGGRRLADELDEIARRCADLPVRDAHSDEEILGYDADDGLPR